VHFVVSVTKKDTLLLVCDLNVSIQLIGWYWRPTAGVREAVPLLSVI